MDFHFGLEHTSGRPFQLTGLLVRHYRDYPPHRRRPPERAQARGWLAVQPECALTEIEEGPI